MILVEMDVMVDISIKVGLISRELVFQPGVFIKMRVLVNLMSSHHALIMLIQSIMNLVQISILIHQVVEISVLLQNTQRNIKMTKYLVILFTKSLENRK